MTTNTDKLTELINNAYGAYIYARNQEWFSHVQEVPSDQGAAERKLVEAQRLLVEFIDQRAALLIRELESDV